MKRISQLIIVLAACILPWVLPSCCAVADATMKAALAPENVEPRVARVAAVYGFGLPMMAVAIPAAVGCHIAEKSRP